MPQQQWGDVKGQTTLTGCLPCGVQALLGETPKCQGKDLPSFQEPGRLVLACVYLLLGSKADGKGGPGLPHFFQDPQLSATSTKTSCPLLQSEQEQHCVHCSALLPGPSLYLTLDAMILSGKVPISLPVLLEHLGLLLIMMMTECMGTTLFHLLLPYKVDTIIPPFCK